MNEMNFDWDDIRLFLSVARNGGLAGARAETGKSAPTLGRRMLALERRLGLELFHRNARGYELTPEGHDLADRLTGLEKQLLHLAGNRHDAHLPLVKISAGAWITRMLCENVDAIVEKDKVRVRFIAADAVLDVSRRETIIGVRNARPSDNALAARKVGAIKFAVYAKDESVSNWAQVIGNTPSANWTKDHSERNKAIEVTNPRSALDLALAGAAKVVLPTFVGDKVEELKRVSPFINELTHEQWLVMHHEDRHLEPVRSLIDHLYPVLKQNCI